MADTRRAFLEAQIRALSPLDFVVFLAPSDLGPRFVKVERDETGASFEARAGGDRDLTAEELDGLAALGYQRADGQATVVSSDVAWIAGQVEAAFSGPFGAASGTPLDVTHGSKRAALELERKVAALRDRVEHLLAEQVGRDHLQVDQDGDFTFGYESTRVWVAPGALPAGPLVVRVLALTNIEIDPTPMLGLFLSETNFWLPFGRFSLDPRQRAVWFEESLLGDYFADEELKFVVGMVASTADQFDDRIAELFGGRVFNPPGQAAEAEARPSPKPGTGGYL